MSISPALMLLLLPCSILHPAAQRRGDFFSGLATPTAFEKPSYPETPALSGNVGGDVDHRTFFSWKTRRRSGERSVHTPSPGCNVVDSPRTAPVPPVQSHSSLPWPREALS